MNFFYRLEMVIISDALPLEACSPSRSINHEAEVGSTELVHRRTKLREDTGPHHRHSQRMFCISKIVASFRNYSASKAAGVENRGHISDFFRPLPLQKIRGGMREMSERIE